MRLPLPLLVAAFSATASAQVELAPLFAPPSEAEKAAVLAEWAQSTPVGDDWLVEAAGTFQGRSIHVVSHTVNGERHYVLLRWPAGHFPGTPLPVLLELHSGDGGTSLQDLQNLDSALPGTFVEDSFLTVMPSFRGEPLVAGALGTYVSEGVSSRFDGDGEDCIALLDVLDSEVPDADLERVAVRGSSRGAGTGPLLAIRDPRVDVLITYFGHTNLFDRQIERGCEDTVNNGAPPTGFAVANVLQWAVGPYLSGTLTLTEARAQLLRRSPSHFAGRLPAVQTHHGELDPAVPFQQSLYMQAALIALGDEAPPFEVFLYPSGTHSVPSLVGHGPRALDWIDHLVIATRTADSHRYP